MYCKPELRGIALLNRTSSKYCPVCKLKVRGPNHEQGSHHKNRVKH